MNQSIDAFTVPLDVASLVFSLGTCFFLTEKKEEYEQQEAAISVGHGWSKNKTRVQVVMT
jgi:hypothetical protein